MEQSEMVWIASKYVSKGYGFEQLKYGDDLYGREHLADEIRVYMDELKEIGRKEFYEKYKQFKLY